ncbi:unnamed protein product [Ostreobium quekettii]|uniref:Uncharacterized protein n=1 Tax=Ostreobium quekettii TaxID=121088 RepID=A0A8S1IUR2_9CHLO|nr:unnamed protein product [Ostreobium quekettii]
MLHSIGLATTEQQQHTHLNKLLLQPGQLRETQLHPVYLFSHGRRHVLSHLRIQHLTRFGDVSRGYCISGVLSEGCYLLHLLLQLDAPLPQHDLPLAVDDVRQHAPLLLPCCIDLRLKPRGRLLHVLELRHDLVLEVEVVVLEDGLQLGVLGDDGVQALDVGVHVLHAHTQGLYFAGVVGQPEKIDVQTSNRISFHELHLEANPSALQLLRLDTFLVDLPLQIVDGGLQRASGLILCR